MADNSAEVAEDYRQALEDLTMNSRIEIATLTNIARENANHGLAIAEVLINHIKKAPPSRTLPALYVLDSIVKNVPTPYALYFGPKLYSIFMGAYTKVDNATRRKMDEMLKTWKEPVPGSLSTKPVFPIEQVRPIENALIAARNAAMAANQNSYQGQQQLLRGRQPVPSRDTPTPPTGRPYPPPPQGQAPYPGPNGHQQLGAVPSNAQQPYPGHPPVSGPNPIPPRATTQPAPPVGGYAGYQPPAGRDVYGAQPAAISIDKLKDDIQQLIVAEKAEFAQDPLDTSKQTRLKALLDLQAIIQSQDMPQEQLMIIRDRVAELAVNKLRPQPQPACPPVTAAAGPAVAVGAAAPVGAAHALLSPYTGTSPTATTSPNPVVPQQPTPIPPAAVAVVAAALARQPSVPTATVPPSHPSVPPTTSGGTGSSGGGISLDSLFGKGALATLLRMNATTPQQTTVPQQTSPPAPPLPPPPVAAPATTGIPPSAVATIAAALQAAPTPPPAAQQSQPSSQQHPADPSRPGAPVLPQDPAALLAILRQSGLLKPAATATPPVDTGIQLTPASLKIYRPHLIPQLLENLGPPCTQCGRRFKTDEEGRRRKTAHMDWHFRVHQRSAEAERRGQHRSWYVDELDWIRSREAIDTEYITPAPGQDDLTSATTTLPYHIAPFPPTGSSSTKTSTSFGPGSKVPYLPVPEDAASRAANSTCPICQEKFEMKWLDEAQEWVWTDAIRAGPQGRVYHASCHREAAGAVSSTTTSGNNGKGVLGKRKAEDEGKKRIKTEPFY